MTTRIEGYQLSPQQKRIWLTQKDDNFTSVAAIEVKGYINPSIFEDHITNIVKNNSILCASFHKVPGLKVPVQKNNLCDVSLLFDYVDVSEEVDFDSYVEEIISKKSNIKHDLSKGSVLDISLACFSKENYIVFISMPSLCSDSVTIIKFFHELLSRYSSNKISDSAVDYFQVSAFFRNILLENEAKEEINFWEKYTDSKIRENLISTDRHMPEKAFLGDKVFSWSVDKKNIDKKAGFLNISKRSVFLSCWQLLLSRLSNSTTIMIHNVFDGRGDEEFIDALGPYARVLPMVSEIDVSLSIEDYIKKTKNDYDRLEEVQYFNPLTKKNDECCSYGFEYIEHEVDSIGDLGFKFIYQHSKREHHLLKCTVLEDADRLIISLYYDPSHFKVETVEQFSQMYKTLLAYMLENPKSQLDEVEVLDDDKNKVLKEWATSETIELPNKCFHEIFEEQASLMPDAIALEYGKESMSYSELDYKSNQLAHELLLRGITHGDAVGICLNRSIQAIVSVLGVLKAGAVYVPLDVKYPDNYLSYMADNSGIVLLVLDSGTANVLTDLPIDRLDLNEESSKLSSNDGATSPYIEVSPKSLAYIIYTSGSTGKPKGVMVSHLSMVNLGNILKRAVHNDGQENSRVSLNAPLSFDASVKQLVLLLHSYTLVLLPDSIRKDGYELNQYLQDRAIDVFDCTPSQLKLLFQAKPGMQGMRYPKKLLIGGEAISPDTWKVLSNNHSINAYNLYGPTEATGDALYSTISHSHPVPVIGKPLPNVQVYILDVNKKQVPIGATGEIYLAGAGLANGYINDSALTSKKFIYNPYSDIPDDLMYRTGDLGRYLSDGDIEYMGRMDRQVKIRGYRIELPEIESIIASISGVKNVTAAVKQGKEGVKRVTAYVVPTDLRSLKLIDYQHYSLPNGLVIAHKNMHESNYLYKEIFEDRTYLQHGIELYDGDCIFDVGGNIGLSTLFFHHECKDLKIFTFEPIPALTDIIRKNVELYDVDSTVLACGLSDADKQITITYYPDYSIMSSLYADSEEEEETVRTYIRNEMKNSDKCMDDLETHLNEFLEGRFEGQKVSCHLRRLSDVIDEYCVECIDLLKIDVQKSELDVLRGVSSSHWKKIKQIILEVHDVQNHIEDAKKLLITNGYRVDLVQDTMLEGTDRFHIIAIRESEHSSRLNLNSEVAKRITPSKIPEVLSLVKMKEHVKEEMPEHMHPSTFVMLNEIPLTSNGKVDFNKLEGLEEKSAKLSSSYEPPRTPLERTLSRIWGEVLEIKDISIHDNFFELGGDSISQIQVVSKANDEGIMLLPIHMFKYPTLSQLAVVANDLQNNDDSVEAAKEINKKDIIATTFQCNILSNLQKDKEISTGVLLRVGSSITVEMISLAIQLIVDNHDVFRLSIDSNSLLRQQLSIAEESQITIHQICLSTNDKYKKPINIEDVVATLEKEFESNSECLFKVYWLSGDDLDDNRLFFQADKLVMDGFSWSIFLKELDCLSQESLEKIKGENTPRVMDSFKDQTNMLLSYYQSESFSKDISYWVDGCWSKIEKLPIDRTDLAPAHTHHEITKSLGLDVFNMQFKNVLGKYRCSLDEILLSVTVNAIRDWAGSSYLQFDTTARAQNQSMGIDLSNAIGPYSSTFPILIYKENRTADSIVQDFIRIKEQIREVPQQGLAYSANQHADYYTNIEQQQTEEASSEIHVSVLDQPSLKNFLVDDKCYQNMLHTKHKHQDYKLNIIWKWEQSDEKVECIFQYDQRYFNSSTIEGLAEASLNNLKQLIDACSTEEFDAYSPSDFPDAGLTQEELNELTRIVDEK